MQNYSSVYLNIYIFEQQKARQKILLSILFCDEVLIRAMSIVETEAWQSIEIR